MTYREERENLSPYQYPPISHDLTHLPLYPWRLFGILGDLIGRPKTAKKDKETRAMTKGTVNLPNEKDENDYRRADDEVHEQKKAEKNS